MCNVVTSEVIRELKNYLIIKTSFHQFFCHCVLHTYVMHVPVIVMSRKNYISRNRETIAGSFNSLIVVAKGLVYRRVVLYCLAKEPTTRFTYDECSPCRMYAMYVRICRQPRCTVWVAEWLLCDVLLPNTFFIA